MARLPRLALLSALLVTTQPGCPVADDDTAGDDDLADDDSSDDDSSDDDSSDDDSGPFLLVVDGGFGSGIYPAGAQVHVWAAVTPTMEELVTSWDGDAALLQDPGEWHTTLTMPAHDVALSATPIQTLMPLTVETIEGHERPKTVRHHIPEDPVGIVLFAHGTGGSGAMIEGIEATYLAHVLGRAGFGVWSTDAEEVDAGDTDGDGKIRWDASLSPDNVDLLNVQRILDQFEADGRIDADTPRLALGMSNGGAFSVTAGAGLELDAVASYCASGRDAAVEATEAPTAWFLCEFDGNDQMDNDQAAAHHQTLLDRGIPTELHVHGPSPLYDQRFGRIPSLGPTSTAIADELRDAGHVDGDGFVIDDAETIAAAVLATPGDYPVLSGLSGEEQLAVAGQVRIMTADHRLYDDYARRMLAFFEARIGP